MVTQFNKKDLSSFGDYLLSEERKQHYINHPDPIGLSLEERLSKVHKEDVENWMAEQNESISFHAPIRDIRTNTQDGDGYALMFTDAKGVTHYFLPGGKYDGLSRDVVPPKPAK